MAEFDVLYALTGDDPWAGLALVLLLVYFVWFYSWGKKHIGPKLGALVALVIVYLVFVKNPPLIWVPALLIVLATFGKELFSKINAYKE